MAICAAAILMIASAPPCAGWEATPQERHDCCERRHCQHMTELGQSGTSQADADQCCARSERGTADRTEQSRPMPVAHVLPALDGIGPAVSYQDAAVHSEPLRPPGPVPIHLLHSVFQI